MVSMVFGGDFGFFELVTQAGAEIGGEVGVEGGRVDWKGIGGQ